MAAGAQQVEPQDRVIVHASLDVFGGGSLPSGGGADPLQSAIRSPSAAAAAVAVQSGRGGSGSAGRQRAGYAARHMQRRRSKIDPGGKPMHKHELPQAGTTRYPRADPRGGEIAMQGMAKLQESMAATTLGGVRTGYGGSSSTDRCGESSPSPPQWQRIAALNHGLPVKRLRAPSGCDGAYEGCWQSDDPQYDGSGRGGEVMGCSSGGYLVRGGGERYRGQGSAGPEPESGYYRADYSGREVSSRSPNCQPSNPRSPYFSDGPERPYGLETYSTSGGSHRFGNKDGGYDDGRASYTDNAYDQDQHYRDCEGYHGGTDRDRFIERDGNSTNSQRGITDQRVRETTPYHEPEERGGVYRDTRDADRWRGGGPKANIHRNSGSSGGDGITARGHGTHDDGGAFEAGTGRGGIRRQEDYTGDRQGHVQQQRNVRTARRQLASPSLAPSTDGIPSKIAAHQDHRSPVGRRRSPCRGGGASEGYGSLGDQDKRPNPESLNEALVKNESDMLLFSKKARQVEYKPCTLKEYRETKPTAYVELGKLQPDLQTEELVAKRANAERVKEFSANLRQINCDTAARKSVNHNPAPKGPAQDSRSRALAFARQIPLPRRKQSAKPAEGPHQPTEAGARRRAGRRGAGLPEVLGKDKPEEELTELEALEALHDDMRRKVQAARTSF